MRNIDKLKKYLKETAAQIRTTRYQYKEAQRTGARISIIWNLIVQLDKLRRDYRHHHIAYCELRGRQRDQIEQTHRKDTLRPNENEIQRIKKEYAWTPEEIEVYLERIEKRKAINAA